MICILLSLCVTHMLCTAGNPVVNIKYGAVEGESIPIHTGQVIDSYLSIPFAKPPVDQLRFAPPQEPEPWTETYPATSIRSACMQSLVSSVQLSHLGWTDFDEDCLFLNIYTPQRNETGLLPVFFFIHGGGFTGGANFIYPGYFMAAKDVVVVTVNYRLDVFGYATTEDEVVPGNMGMLDQVLALQFVQENIAAFGGDANRVTICGESAGGASVGLLLMSPLATGLFHNAILHSGNELSPWVLQVPDENPSNYFQQIAEEFDCPTDSSQEMVDCLRSVPARPLANARYNCTEGYECSGFGPVIDGVFLPDFPAALRERGEYNKVPEIIGVMDDECSIFMFPVTFRGLNRTAFDEMIYFAVENTALSWPDPARTEDAVQALRFQYADWPYFYDPERNREMSYKMCSDEQFGYSSDAQAKSHINSAPVYFYVYEYVIENSVFPEYLGAFHGLDMVMLFGWPFIWMDENEAAFNHSQISTLNANYTDRDAAFSDNLVTMWTNFVKYSNPTPDDGSTALTWPEFTADNLTYAYLVETTEVHINYRQKFYAFWTEYLNYIIFGEEFFNYQDAVSLAHMVSGLWTTFSTQAEEYSTNVLQFLYDDLEDIEFY